MIGSQFCAQFPQQRLTRASSGRSNPIVRSPLECGCSRWVEERERERERGGFEMKERGNPLSFFDLFGSGVLGFIPLAFFFYCYLPVSNLYLADGFILPFFNLVCLVC